MKATLGSTAILLAGLMLGSEASAAITSFDLEQSNISQLADGTPYLQLTIFDGSDAVGKNVGSYTAASGDVVFEVTALAALDHYAQNKFGLDEFAFNTTMSLSQFTAGDFKLPTSSWTVSMGSHNADGYGAFELIPMTNGANNTQSPLWFAITNVSGDSAATYEKLSTGNAGQGNTDFAAHVINFSVTDGSGTATSAWFGGQTPAPVPLPAGIWLLLSGLGGMGLLRHRARRLPTGQALLAG